MKHSSERITARAEALEECAGHLEQCWTDDDLERSEGNYLSWRLRKEAAGLRTRAATRANADKSKLAESPILKALRICGGGSGEVETKRMKVKISSDGTVVAIPE